MAFFPGLLFVFIFYFFAACLFTIIKFYSSFFFGREKGDYDIAVCANDDGIKSFSYSTAKYCKFSPRQQLGFKNFTINQKKNTLRWMYSGNVIHKIYLAHLIVKLNSGVFFSNGIVVFGDIFIGNKCHRPLEFHLKMSPSSATSIRHDFCIINTLACHKFNTSHPNAITIIIFIMWTEKPNTENIPQFCGTGVFFVPIVACMLITKMGILRS